MPSLIDLILAGRRIEQHAPWPRAVVDSEVWNFAGSELAHGHWQLLGLWGEQAAVHMAILDDRAGRSRSSACNVSTGVSRRSDDTTLRRFVWSAPSAICSAWWPTARPTPASGSITAPGALSIRLAIALRSRRSRCPTGFLPRKGRGCIRSRSGRFTPASSSPAISASPQAARPWSGSSSAWATPTRASRD